MKNAVMLTENLVKSLSPNSLCLNEGKCETLILNSVDRFNLQTYLLNGKFLPTEEKEFMKLLKVPSDEKEKFKDLLNFYRDVQSHCSTFYDGGFTDSVTLASDVVDYSRKVKVYYTSLLEVVEKVLSGDETQEDGGKIINGILDEVIKYSDTYQKRCESIMDAVEVFYNQTVKDLITLRGQDGESGLIKKYSTEFKLSKKTLEVLRSEYNAFSDEMKNLKDDYNFNVAVSATTPAYAWVFPFGTIPAIVVAGVYGDRAVKSKKKLDKAIADLECTNKLINLYIALEAACKQLDELKSNMMKAMEPVQKMKSFWKAMSDDLKSLKDSTENVEEMCWVIKKLGLDEVMLKWNALAVYADEYRLSAFIADIFITSDTEEKSKVA